MTIAKMMIMGYDLKMFPDAEAEDREGTIKRMNAAQRNRMDAYYKPIYEDLKAMNLSGNALTEWKYQGQSMLPLFKNKKGAVRDAIYYHYYENGEHAVSPHFGIKTKRYKLIRFYQRVEAWELYDLEIDPHEMNNLFAKKDYEKITAGLKNKLKQLIDKYEDEDAAKLFLTPIMGNQ
jgi:hypothetical protein